MMLQCKIQYMGVTSFSHSTCTLPVHDATTQNSVHRCHIIQHALCQYMMLQCKIHYTGVSLYHSLHTLQVHVATTQTSVYECLSPSSYGYGQLSVWHLFFFSIIALKLHA